MKNVMVLIAVLAAGTQVLVAQRQPNPRLTSLLNEKDSMGVQQKLADLGKSEKEEDIGLVLQFYNAKSDSRRADSVYQLAQRKFPKGQYAFIAAGNKVTLEDDLKKKEGLYKKLTMDFPGRDYSMQEYGLAYEYAKNSDVKNMYKYAALISDGNFKLEARVILAETLLQQGDLKNAETLVSVAMDSMKQRMLTFDTAKAAATNMDRMGPAANPQAAYYRYAITYSKILRREGKTDEAFKYAKEAYDNGNKRNPDLNNQYLSLLLATNRLEAALPLMEQAIKEGNASEEVKSRLADAYKAVKGGADGFAGYKAGLENVLREKVKAEVVKMLIKEHASDFTLTDVNGHPVALSDLKGKVVVLDFWATWCGPCKKSFPAMQMAVNKYKDDANVAFLFIHTWERGDTDPTLAAKKYVTDNHFTFRVLMDKKDPATSVNKVVTDYGIKGIPAKFVIDENGDIRFKLTGFSGGNDAAVEELSAMIELAKKTG